jgi:hypothetical protein
VNAVFLRAASTDRRFLWLTPREKSSSFSNCTLKHAAFNRERCR